MHWARAVTQLRDGGRPGVLVTVSDVRGHAPREVGAKMVVAVDDSWGSIGGGNLEAEALVLARGLLTDQLLVGDVPEPVHIVRKLSDKAHQEHGRQCCGGEVTVTFEPLPAPQTIAIVGLGHVGLELARILSRLDLRLELIDSRSAQLDPLRVAELTDQTAIVHLHHRVVPEMVLDRLPATSTLLVMTHDHAEDFAVCDAALRRGGWARIGLIGSATKAARFRRLLLEAGHDEAAVGTIECPIGDQSLGKEPAAIAIAIASSLLRDRSRV